MKKNSKTQHLFPLFKAQHKYSDTQNFYRKTVRTGFETSGISNRQIKKIYQALHFRSSQQRHKVFIFRKFSTDDKKKKLPSKCI